MTVSNRYEFIDIEIKDNKFYEEVQRERSKYEKLVVKIFLVLARVFISRNFYEDLKSKVAEQKVNEKFCLLLDKQGKIVESSIKSTKLINLVRKVNSAFNVIINNKSSSLNFNQSKLYIDLLSYLSTCQLEENNNLISTFDQDCLVALDLLDANKTGLDFAEDAESVEADELGGEVLANKVTTQFSSVLTFLKKLRELESKKEEVNSAYINILKIGIFQEEILVIKALNRANQPIIFFAKAEDEEPGAIKTITKGYYYNVADYSKKGLVILKELNLHHVKTEDSEQYLAQWKNSQVTATLSHPHLIKTHEIIDLPNLKGLILEEGGSSLETQLTDLDQPVIPQLIEQLLIGVAFMHGKGLIHGDIKPENIVINQSNQLKLIDFDLTKKIEDKQCISEEGTPQYLPPLCREIKTDNIQLDKQDQRKYSTDLWALGKVIFEMISSETEDQNNKNIVIKNLICTNLEKEKEFREKVLTTFGHTDFETEPQLTNPMHHVCWQLLNNGWSKHYDKSTLQGFTAQQALTHLQKHKKEMNSLNKRQKIKSPTQKS